MVTPGTGKGDSQLPEVNKARALSGDAVRVWCLSTASDVYLLASNVLSRIFPIRDLRKRKDANAADLRALEDLLARCTAENPLDRPSLSDLSRAFASGLTLGEV